MPNVTIDCYHRDLAPYPGHPLVVVLDVIRATTTAITAAAAGVRCIPVASLEEAEELRSSHPHALLAGELAGEMPDGFDLNNSPPVIAEEADPDRPLILLSSSGSRLMREAGALHEPVLVGALRNWRATAAAARGERDVVIACAGTRGEFRDEDQLAAGWIGGALLNGGFEAEAPTADHIRRWRSKPARAAASGKSAAYLRASGQSHDLDFILDHVDDLPQAFWIRDGAVEAARPLMVAGAP